VLYYDTEGDVRAVGAETLAEGIFEEAEEGNWFKVEWCVADAFSGSVSRH